MQHVAFRFSSFQLFYEDKELKKLKRKNVTEKPLHLSSLNAMIGTYSLVYKGNYCSFHTKVTNPIWPLLSHGGEKTKKEKNLKAVTM